MDQVRLDPDDWPAALADTDGRQVVVAGPGTGKTQFLVRRVGQILRDGKARPGEIIVLTFSRRASGRLRRLIESETGATGIPVDVATFHSLALRLVEAATGGDRPIPLTTPEQVGLVRQILATEDPDSWPPIYRGILDSQAFSTEVADFLLRCSERLLAPEDLGGLAGDHPDWKGIPDLYARYLMRLSDLGRTDYGVLLAEAVRLLRTRQGGDLVARFGYVLVDEYQDTTPAQAEMAELLAASHGNLTVAGDPYQSIFSFRGAELANIAAFSEVPGTRRVVLGRSFRVPGQIMEAALRVVSGGDLPGAAGPVEPAPHEGRAEAYVFDQETAEAEWIAREVEHAIKVEGVPTGEVAVLVRSKRQLLSELSRALHRRSIPHDPPHSRLVDHPAVTVVQDVVAASVNGGRVGTAVESETADRAMRRILLGPLIGASVGLERQMFRDRRRGRSWHEVLSDHLPERPGLIGLLADPDWAASIGAADGFWEVWGRLDGIPDLVASPERSEWRRAWTAFGQMVARQAERDATVSLSRLFELVEDEDFEATPLIPHRLSEDRITLTTLHQAKGLEFSVVFIANAVEGVFPDLRRSRRMLRPELLSPERAADPDAHHLFQLQEEMRLAYTAMTRASKRLVWTATDAGVDQGERRPSRFLIAAAGRDRPGPPAEMDREPITLWEAEAGLRRSLLDAAAPPAARLAAARVLGSPPQPWWDAAAFAGVPEPGPDRPVMSPGFRLSPSQADSYHRCPRRYVMERRLRLGDATSVYAHFGELTHDVLELAETEVVSTGRHHGSLDRVLEIVDQVWEGADFGTPELDLAWKGKAVEMLTKLYGRWPGKGEPVDLELGVEAEIGGVTWTGRVDRVERGDEGLRIVDYKTSAKAPRAEDIAQSIQLAFYTEAVSSSLGEVVAAEMWFPRVDSVSVTTRKLDMHRLPDVRETMTSITVGIAEENWAPKVGAGCSRCPFRRSCPAWPDGKGAFLP